MSFAGNYPASEIAFIKAQSQANRDDIVDNIDPALQGIDQILANQIGGVDCIALETAFTNQVGVTDCVALQTAFTNQVEATDCVALQTAFTNQVGAINVTTLNTGFHLPVTSFFHTNTNANGGLVDGDGSGNVVVAPIAENGTWVVLNNMNETPISVPIAGLYQVTFNAMVSFKSADVAGLAYKTWGTGLRLYTGTANPADKVYLGTIMGSSNIGSLKTVILASAVDTQNTLTGVSFSTQVHLPATTPIIAELFLSLGTVAPSVFFWTNVPVGADPLGDWWWSNINQGPASGIDFRLLVAD